MEVSYHIDKFAVLRTGESCAGRDPGKEEKLFPNCLIAATDNSFINLNFVSHRCISK